MESKKQFILLLVRCRSAFGCLFTNLLKKEYEKEKSRGWVWIDPVTPYSAPKPPELKDSDWINHAKPLFNRLDPGTDFELVSNTSGYIYKENRKNLELLIKEDSDFFDTIEKNPLTEQQRKAIACFAPRTLVVASAGSGKSSVLAAKTAYAIKKGFFLPSEILLLAFNNDAAAGLKNKVTSATGKDIEVCTFHKFCLRVIGNATGRKPSVAKYIDQGQGDLVMRKILLDLIKDPLYKHKLDSYNLFFGPRHKEDQEEEKNRGFKFRTKEGEIVKSKAERIFADLMHDLQISYEYEMEYPFPTADEAHSQYHPDFYLPQIDTWVEIWAAADSEPDPFPGYQAGKIWKRKTHLEHNTKLKEFVAKEIDQTRAGDNVCEWLFRISEEIQKEKKEEDRKTPKALSDTQKEFAGLLRTFQVHAYNNDLSTYDLEEKISSENIGLLSDLSLRLQESVFKEKLFLELYGPAEAKWREMLKKNGETDFEMMMRQAAEIIESGKWMSPYRLIMVDEFQDTSQLRARILKALLRTDKTRLVAVGDDWQSIYRFTGADISIMKNFSDHFGGSEIPKLEQTFRCSPEICDVSKNFILKNPSQLPKNVKPAFPLREGSVSLLLVDKNVNVIIAIKDELNRLDRLHLERGEKKTVAILGRFNSDFSPFINPDDPDYIRPSTYPALDVSCSTIHRSKGLEFDYIILARMEQDCSWEFPCQIQDDPILDLAMPEKEGYEFAEERRLLYVALTRARSSVAIIANCDFPSIFTKELVDPKSEYSVKVEKLNPPKNGEIKIRREELSKLEAFSLIQFAPTRVQKRRKTSRKRYN
jgi:DNA helicase-4